MFAPELDNVYAAAALPDKLISNKVVPSAAVAISVLNCVLNVAAAA